MRKIFFVLALLCFTSFAQADYRVVISEQIVEEADERTARRKAIDQATDAVTLEMVKKELGRDRFAENKSKIETQVQASKNRFIPFFKILSGRKEAESYRFKIEVKVSMGDLRTVLQQKGLFASQNRTGITLPFIEYSNQLKGESVRWWSPNFESSKTLNDVALNFEAHLFEGFIEKGLFLLRPLAFNMQHMLPQTLRKTELTQTEMVQITNLKQGQLYLEGRVDVFSSPIRENALRVRVQISCRQTSNGKSVAEVVRTLDAGAGKKIGQLRGPIKNIARESGRDIASQVYDLWQRGALESQVVQLAVTGSLNHQQMNQFKKALSDRLGLQDLRERLFEPGRVTFETDYSGGVSGLSRKLNGVRFEGFMSQVVSSKADQIILDVKIAQ